MAKHTAAKSSTIRSRRSLRMGRGEYGRSLIGNDVQPQEDFRKRFLALDVAIADATNDFVGQSAPKAEWSFINAYWLPFVAAWNDARPDLFTRGRGDEFTKWADRYSALHGMAQSAGLITTADPRIR